VVIILMGVAGAGKTTLGKWLAQALGWRFVEGDDFHPPANVAKMAAGIPLTDEDRVPWLERLRGLITERLARGEDAVLTCSALKQSYRRLLTVDP
jgi:gluconokinase